MLRLKNYWNNYWESKKFIPIFIFKNLYLTRIRAEYVKKFMFDSILEIGCGDGKLLSLLPKNINVTGLDISSFALKKAKKNLENRKASLVLGDALNIKFDDNMFDLVLADGLIENYTDKIERLIKEMHRVTKKGGYVIIILSNNDFIRKILFNYIYSWDKEKIKTTEEYKKIFNSVISRISKKYKIEIVPKSFGILMAIVVKKC